MDNFIEILKEQGKSVVRLNKVCVLPFGGRVLGLYPQKGLNVLWVNSALGSEASARALLTGGGWTNLGGDRTWVSPEIELFIGDLSRPMVTYKVPPGLDPADYRVVSQRSNAVELETVGTVDFYRSGGRAELSIRKRVTELDVPDFALPLGVSAAGYELTTTLSVSDGVSASARLALWNLLQVPGGGEIIVPLKGLGGPVAFFGQQQFRQEGNLLHASVPVTPESYKFGVLADSCRGLMLYLNLDAAQPFMIFRRVSVGPQDRYFDAPFTDPQRKGVAQQVYVDNGAFGGFGEMEHHSLAIVPGIRNEVTDTCTTWAFAGQAEALRDLVEFLVKG